MLWHAQRSHWHCCATNFFLISSRIIRHTVFFIRKSDSAAHGTAESLTPLCKYDTAVPLDLIFEWLWLPWKGLSIAKNIHRQIVLNYSIPITFTQKTWGLTRDSFFVTAVSLTPLWRFHSRFSPRILSHIQKGFNPCIRGLYSRVSRFWNYNGNIA
jgi:hypothetical protein